MSKIIYAVIGISLLGACCVFGLLMVRRAGTDSPSDQLRHDEQVSVPQAESTIPETDHGPSQDATSITELREEVKLNATNGTRESQSAPSLAPSERSQFLKSAQAELERLRVPWEGRESTVVLNGDEITVTFLPPKGARAGRFIIKIERETKKILDVEIWR